MNKEFVPYELAVKLKELGFDEPCLSYWEGESFSNHLATIKLGDDYIIPAPLYQQAFRWFREKHNLKGGIEYIGGLTPKTTWWDIYVVGHFNTNYKEMSMKYQPYEEAELACLTKLIEIVEQQNQK